MAFFDGSVSQIELSASVRMPARRLRPKGRDPIRTRTAAARDWRPRADARLQLPRSSAICSGGTKIYRSQAKESDQITHELENYIREAQPNPVREQIKGRLRKGAR